MAASTTTTFPVPVSESSASVSHSQAYRRRRISPLAGRALEVLGHAIDYLVDEFIHEGISLSPRKEQLEAVQLLMAFNRQIYFECPEAPSFGERCRKFMRRGSA